MLRASTGKLVSGSLLRLVPPQAGGWVGRREAVAAPHLTADSAPLYHIAFAVHTSTSGTATQTARYKRWEQARLASRPMYFCSSCLNVSSRRLRVRLVGADVAVRRGASRRTVWPRSGAGGTPRAAAAAISSRSRFRWRAAAAGGGAASTAAVVEAREDRGHSALALRRDLSYRR